MTIKQLVVAAVVLVATAPVPARADWLIAPFIGGNAGGDAVKPRANFGFDAAWMGAGAVGIQFDAGWTPNFFDTSNTDVSTLVSGSSVSTYMVNAIVGVPVGGQRGMGVRPYGSAGLGGIHTRMKSDLGLVDAKNTDLGWNAGAGAIGFFTDQIGVTGDVRYFGNFKNDLSDNTLITDSSRFGFWRITGGVVFRFAM